MNKRDKALTGIEDGFLKLSHMGMLSFLKWSSLSNSLSRILYIVMSFLTSFAPTRGSEMMKTGALFHGIAVRMFVKDRFGTMVEYIPVAKKVRQLVRKEFEVFKCYVGSTLSGKSW
jgi:hypothetical protein